MKQPPEGRPATSRSSERGDAARSDGGVRDGEAQIESCEDALRLLAAFLDGELESGSRAEVERHLSICRSCYSRAEFERALKEKIAEGRADASRHLRERLRGMIRRFTVTASSD